MKNNILFFVTSLDSGGIENYLLRFLDYSKGRFNPIVICKRGKFGELYEQYAKIPGIQLIAFKTSYFNIFSWIMLFRLMKQKHASTICDFTGNFAGPTLALASLIGIKKRIVFYRGSTNKFPETFFRIRYNEFLKFLTNSYATKILSNSQSALEYFYPDRKKVDARFKVIYNGVDAKMFDEKIDKDGYRKSIGVPINSFVVGHAGRYNSAKNHITIAETAKELVPRYEDIYFVICGKNTEVFKREICKKYPALKDRLIALGYRNDIPNVLQSFDVFFFPSITEGQPNALIEAMISGLPIVASNIDPILETTPPTLHSQLLSPSDYMGFSRIIEDMYFCKNLEELNNYSNWSKATFNSKKLFDEFFKELETASL